MGRAAINDATYPLLSPYVLSISHSASGTLFVLHQEQVLMKAYRAWGSQGEENVDTFLTMSTRVRLLGILFLDDNRDNLNILVENCSSQRA